MPSANLIPASRLSFPDKQQVELETFEVGVAGAEEVLVETRLSLMSTGTENIVFNRLFDVGTHWDNWVKYPFYPGYACVGVILKTGDAVSHLQPGDRVAYRVPHQSHEIVKADACTKIPEQTSFENAVWFALAKIAFHGAKAANYTLGDSVLIIGAGPIGQMSIRWAVANGASTIIAVDRLPARLALAKQGGATACISTSVGDAREQIMAANGGKLPRVVIDSTGNAEVFKSALSLAADFGKIVVMGDTGRPAQQSMSSDLIIRGLTEVGAHDGHNDEEWNDATIAKLFFDLTSSGRFSVDGLISHHFKPTDCAEAYGVANREREKTMGVVFDWVSGGGSSQ